MTIQAGLSPGEAERRLRDLERLRRRLHSRLLQELPATIARYVEDELVPEVEAEGFREGVAAGTEAPQAPAAETSPAVSRAVADTVACLQVFESLRRIRGDHDDLLRALIEHKDLVMADEDGERSQMMTALLRHPGFLESAVAVMGRRDRELRLLAARAAPYDRFDAGTPDRALTIEPAFVDDLRDLGSEAYTDRLHAAEASTRQRARADVGDFILLLDRLIEATPLRRRLRLLIANRILSEATPEVWSIYRSGKSQTQARQRAERLLAQRLRPVFVEASREELAAARRRQQAVLLRVEQEL